MSANRYTEVSNQSWFGRLGSAFTGIIGGLVLIIIAFVLIFWNEGRSVKRYKTLKEGSGLVMTVSTESIDPANEGKLVHISGFAETTDKPTDPLFGVSEQALKLIRSAEMYQWKETTSTEERKKLGGGTEKVTTYDYDKAWQSHLIDSGSFKHPEGHENPRTMLIQNDSANAWPVNIGAFELSPSIINSITGSQSLMLDSSSVKIPPVWTGKTQIQGNEIYMGNNAGSPDVGDIRVSFSIVPQQDVSIVAKTDR